MKITDAIFYTDNSTVRLEFDTGDKFYLTEKGKVYSMHPINYMAEEVKPVKMKEVKLAAKVGKYKNDMEVRKWL